MKIVIFFLLSFMFPFFAFGANDITRTPWMFDSVTATAPKSTSLTIRSIRWVNVTTAGHKLILNDSKGRKIFEATCPSANSEYEMSLPLFSTWGVSVQQIDSGILFLGVD
jgi:hypothetical protein